MKKDEKLYCKTLGIMAYAKKKREEFGVLVTDQYGIPGYEAFKQGFDLLPNIELFLGVCKDAIKNMENDK